MTITTIISLMLLIYVQRHRPITLDFGGWTAPFGIQFLGDSLSLIMVTTASVCDYFNYGIWIWAWRT